MQRNSLKASPTLQTTARRNVLDVCYARTASPSSDAHEKMRWWWGVLLRANAAAMRRKERKKVHVREFGERASSKSFDIDWVDSTHHGLSADDIKRNSETLARFSEMLLRVMKPAKKNATKLKQLIKLDAIESMGIEVRRRVQQRRDVADVY